MSHATVETPSLGRNANACSPQNPAWATWVFLLMTPLVVLPFGLHLTPPSATPRPESAEEWLGAITISIFIAIPVVRLLFIWRPIGVPSTKYYLGVFSLWAAIAGIGLTAEIACMATHALLPNAVIALVAPVIYVLLWPTGPAMRSLVYGPTNAGRT